jgi:hypothetical protein
MLVPVTTLDCPITCEKYLPFTCWVPPPAAIVEELIDCANTHEIEAKKTKTNE